MHLWLLPALFWGLPASAAPEPPQDAVRPVRVLVQNIYGRREKECEERYKTLAKQILSASPPYDVVALNEHWKVPGDRWFSCDADVLTKTLEAGGLKGIKNLPRTDDVLQAGGGNSVFSHHRIVDSYESRFVNSRDLPLSGFALARVELAPGMVLDLWDVHLEAGSDGCDDDCRWEQATDLGSSIELFSGLPEKGQTGNPVLIVGDFNTGGPLAKADKPPYSGNGGYKNVLEAIGDPRDLWLELGSGDGYTYDCQRNGTQKCDYRERIDYVLLPESPKILHPSSPYVLVPKSISVVRWATPAGQPVSDHYGLDVTLELRRRPAVPAGVSDALDAAGERIKRPLRDRDPWLYPDDEPSASSAPVAQGGLIGLDGAAAGLVRKTVQLAAWPPRACLPGPLPFQDRLERAIPPEPIRIFREQSGESGPVHPSGGVPVQRIQPLLRAPRWYPDANGHPNLVPRGIPGVRGVRPGPRADRLRRARLALGPRMVFGSLRPVRASAASSPAFR